MKKQLFWNDAELRLRAGWRILIQVMMISFPLMILGGFGLYSNGNLAIKMTATALPITLFSIWILGKLIDKRAYSDYGIQLKQKKWWSDYGFGWLAGFLAASCFTGMLIFFGWADIVFSGKLAADPASFVIALLISLLAYAGVGIFEELLRTYQIRNITEGLAGTQIGTTGAMIFAVLLAGVWSVIMHIASNNPPFLLYVMVTGVIYGLFFLWTGRAALAMAIHFAWDFTVSSIFQIGSVSEASLFLVTIREIPNSGFEILPMSGMIAKSIGLIIILLWIKKKEGKIETQKDLASPTLI
jgi:membrane protease YdiL (CAAX protease family)